MNRPIKVLLLDDKADEMQDFKLEAKNVRVQIINEIKNSVDAINELKKNHQSYDAIILDALFFENPDSPSIRDAGALSDTLKEIERLLHAEEVHLPHCIYTGHFKEIGADTVVRGKKVFVKGRDQKEMFEYLKDEVEATEGFRMKNKFNEIFELFDLGLIPIDKQTDLVEIMIKSEKKGKYNDDDAFNPVRKMYEVLIAELYNQAYEVDKHQDIVPDGLFGANDELNITGSYYYLSGFDVKRGDEVFIRGRGQAVWPDHIANLVNLIVQITHQNSHDYPEDVHHYTYKSVVYSLLELFLWYKEFITNYKTEHTDG